MDCSKARGEGWPSWRQQVKKAVVALAIILAAGLLYVQLKKDYGFNDPIINTELQRDYRGGGAWHDDPEMLKDYSYNAKVSDSNIANTLQPDELSANKSRLNDTNVDDRLRNASSSAGHEELIMDTHQPQEGMIKDGNPQSDKKAYHLGKQGLVSPNATQAPPQKGDFLGGREEAESDKGGSGRDEHAKSGGSLEVDQAMNGSTIAHHGGEDDERRKEHGGTDYNSNKLVGPSLPPSSSISPSNISDSGADNNLSKKAAAVPPIPASTPPPAPSFSYSFEHNVTQGLVKGDSRTNETDPHSSNWKRKAPLWPYSRLELQLYAAQIAIQNAPLSNSSSNIVLHDPIYHNLSQFIRSYELMEKMFRVYIYKEGKKPLVHTGPALGIYSTEGLFIRQMEKNKQFRTESVEEALALFLPYSVANMVDELYEPPSTSMLPLSSFIKDYVNEVAARHPFWNRTRGGDHFFVSCHDWGLMTTFEHAELRHNAMKVLCNADSTTEFEKGRDASLPEFYMHATEKLDGGMEEEKGVWPPQRRDILAFFAGQMHGRVRPKLLEYWEYPKGGKEMQVYGVLPKVEAHRMSYKERMHASRYCLCPMGYEVNSPRLVEAIQALCVPVIIADGFVLPFSHVLDWASFSVTVAEKDLPSLKSILQAIPEHAYMTMQGRLQYVRRHFAWHENPQPFDTFHMILHSVWTSRLNNITSV